MGITSHRLLTTRRDAFREALEIAYFMQGQQLEQVMKWPFQLRHRAWKWLKEQKDREDRQLEKVGKK